MATSKRLLASYVLDWLVIIAIWAAGGGLQFVTPYKRPFSLLDLSISYPYTTESISTTILVVVGLLAPAAIIAIVTIVFVPGPSFRRQLGRGQVLSLKLWELEKALAGLALAVGAAFFVSQSLKNMFGKPRPDLIARCMPDVAGIDNHVVGGYGQGISPLWTLVSHTICTNTESKTLDDGFRSWPSGHSVFSWSGLLYLSLFLCSKLAIRIPHLSPSSAPAEKPARKSNDHELQDMQFSTPYDIPAATLRSTTPEQSSRPLRNQAASPPDYLIVIAFLPVAVAFYITSTRYVEFYHAGFDIISGSLIGIISAYASFRWYHLPVGRGEGWAWGPRSERRAFGIGVGTANYTDADIPLSEIV